MADNSVTLVGNLTDDPELRFTPSGRQVANFTVAVNKRFKNNEGQWEDRLDGFFRCNCWGEMAENVSESLNKGTRIVVTGRLQQRSWEDAEGGKRSAIELQVDEVGPSLRWSTAAVQKSRRSGGQQTGQQQTGQQQGGGDWSSQGQGGSWATPQQGGQSQGGDWSAPAPVGGPGEKQPQEGGF
jgi:single-strand DNA-binding protein